mgnify:CR=1 FL=1
MSNFARLKEKYDRDRRAELEGEEAKAIINAHRELNGGDDVARPTTDPEKRDEELKKIAKDVINEVNASRDGGLTAEGLNLVQTEILAQFAILRERVDAKFKELATSQEDALRDALQGVSKKLDTLAAEREKASETIGSGEKNILEQIEAMGEVVDANAATLEYIESQVADLGGKMKNMEHRINVNTAKELHGSGNNAPVANASAALEADTPTQTINQDTGKKKPKKSCTATTANTTTKGAKCTATKTDGSTCTKLAEPGFLTCRYQTHRAQEEELKKKAVPVPRVGSTASFQDTATNAQAPPTTTQPSVAQSTRPSRFKPPPSGAATKKRKRGGDEEELEHNHLPGETREDCRACAMGCGELTQPTIGPILHSEEADQPDYFGSPEPENQVALGFPPSPPINGPIHNIPSPTSTEADRFDREDDQAEQGGFRNQDELMEEIRQSQQRDKRQYKRSSSASKRTPYNFINFGQFR